MEAIDRLLENNILTDNDKGFKQLETFLYQNRSKIENLFREKLGFELVFGSDYIKLEKVSPYSHSDFDFKNRESYIYLVFLLKYLDYEVSIKENKYFDLKKFLQWFNEEYEKFFSESLALQEREVRINLLEALNYLEDNNFLEQAIGDDEIFLDNNLSSEDNLIYSITDNIVNFINANSLSVDLIDDFSLERLEDSFTLEQRAYQKLIFSPVIFKRETKVYNFIKQNRGGIEEDLNQVLSGTIEVYEEFLFFNFEEDSISATRFKQLGKVSGNTSYLDRFIYLIIERLVRYPEDEINKDELFQLIGETGNDYPDFLNNKLAKKIKSRSSKFLREEIIKKLEKFSMLKEESENCWRILPTVNLFKEVNTQREEQEDVETV
mgnify:CR=1 FL=1